MPDRPHGDPDTAIPDGPPYPVDLLADLHAGVLDDEVATALWPRVQADPDAARVLAALDATRADLASTEVTPEAPPAAVAAAIESTLAAIRADTDTHPVDGRARIDSLDDARDRARDARRRRGMVIASVAAGIIAVVTLVVAVSTASMSSQGTVSNADGPSSTTVATSPGPAVPAAALLSVLGRSSATFTGPGAGATRVARCVAANGVAASVQVVGSGPVTVGGRAAVVILLSTGLAGRFDALVVGPECDTGVPATIDRTTLGAPIPSARPTS